MDNILTFPGAKPFEVISAFDTETKTYSYTVADGAIMINGLRRRVPGIEGVGDAEIFLNVYEVRYHLLIEQKDGSFSDSHDGWTKDEDGKRNSLPAPTYIAAMETVRRDNGVITQWGYGRRAHHRWEDYSEDIPDECFGIMFMPSLCDEISTTPIEGNIEDVSKWATYHAGMASYETHKVILSTPLLSIKDGRVTMDETAWLCVGRPETQEPDKRILLRYNENKPGFFEQEVEIAGTRGIKSSLETRDGPEPPQNPDDSDSSEDINENHCSCKWCQSLFKSTGESIDGLEDDIKKYIKNLRRLAELLWPLTEKSRENLTVWNDDFRAIGIEVKDDDTQEALLECNLARERYSFFKKRSSLCVEKKQTSFFR